MDTPWPANFPGDRRRAAEELVRGREFTNQLQALLSGSPIGCSGDEWASAEDLVLKITRSFSDALGILNFGESEEVSQAPNYLVGLNSLSSDGRRSDVSRESCKKSAFKDRRGCYKRRKTTQTWTKVTQTIVDDGHAWRKYGQKVILNAKHPRNYYRCTHKFDQGCQATKQVQKTEGEPPMYQITYTGHHTCRNLHRAPQIILDTAAPPSPCHDSSSSILLSFTHNNFNSKQQLQDQPSFFPQFVKQELPYRDEICCADFTANDYTRNLQSPTSDYHHHHHHYYLSPGHHPDLTAAFESPTTGKMPVLSSSDQGDVLSFTASTDHSLDMDMHAMVSSVDFSDDVLQYAF